MNKVPELHQILFPIQIYFKRGLVHETTLLDTSISGSVLSRYSHLDNLIFLLILLCRMLYICVCACVSVCALRMHGYVRSMEFTHLLNFRECQIVSLCIDNNAELGIM